MTRRYRPTHSAPWRLFIGLAGIGLAVWAIADRNGAALVGGLTGAWAAVSVMKGRS